MTTEIRVYTKILNSGSRSHHFKNSLNLNLGEADVRTILKRGAEVRFVARGKSTAEDVESVKKRIYGLEE